MIPFINLKLQYEGIRKEILDATDEVLSSGVLMNGANTDLLEFQLSRRIDVPHVVCVGSGTEALEIIARFHKESFYGVTKTRPRVVVPALTYPATINAFISTGWDVIIGEVNSETGILDLDKIPTTDFDAVCIVGLYGQPVFADWYLRRKEGHNKLDGKIIIEDAAQHWLASDYSGAPIMKAISFDPTKNLPNYGSGGAIACWDEYSRDWFKMYRDNGKPHKSSYGTNSRISEVDAAQMLVKLKYLDSWQERRLEIAEYYCERFKDTPNIRVIMDKMANKAMHGLQKFVVEIDNRDSVRDLLLADGVECKIHYEQPLHELEPNSIYPGPTMIGAASALARRVLSLPFYPELTDKEIKLIADRVIHHVEHDNVHSAIANHN